MSAQMLFLRWRICTHTMYQGTRPPENSIVKKAMNENSFLWGKSLRERGYAYSAITRVLSTVPSPVTMIVMTYARATASLCFRTKL